MPMGETVAMNGRPRSPAVTRYIRWAAARNAVAICSPVRLAPDRMKARTPAFRSSCRCSLDDRIRASFVSSTQPRAPTSGSHRSSGVPCGYRSSWQTTLKPMPRSASATFTRPRAASMKKVRPSGRPADRFFDLCRGPIVVSCELRKGLARPPSLCNDGRWDVGSREDRTAKGYPGIDHDTAGRVKIVWACKGVQSNCRAVGPPFDPSQVGLQDTSEAELTLTTHVDQLAILLNKQVQAVRPQLVVDERMLRAELAFQIV